MDSDQTPPMRSKAGRHSAGTRLFQESRKLFASDSYFEPDPRIASEIRSFWVIASRLCITLRWTGPQVWL